MHPQNTFKKKSIRYILKNTLKKKSIRYILNNTLKKKSIKYILKNSFKKRAIRIKTSRKRTLDSYSKTPSRRSIHYIHPQKHLQEEKQ
jgi:hypothetical protein